jgi:uncharacterized protein YndB with AHSA1/START domain
MAEENSATEKAAREVMITRVFNASRSYVFSAWTDPQRLAQWWGPRGFTNPVCILDVRPGGAWRIIMRAPGGIDYPGGGVYREVVEPERLVFTNVAMDREGHPVLEGLTKVNFAEQSGGTELALHTRAVALAPDAGRYLDGMQTGWSQSLDKLAEELAKENGLAR